MKVLIKPSRLIGEVEAPPSKSYTHRAYTLALLSAGASKIIDPLRSGDTDATLNACKLLGAEIYSGENHVVIQGGSLRVPEDVIDAGNSGTTLRFFTAISSIIPAKGYAVLTGDESLRKRPMKPLLEALRRLGVRCWSSRLNGSAPIIVECGGVDGGETEIRGDLSSQFISALLISSIKTRNGVLIKVDGEIVSKPYIDATLEAMKRFGFKVRNDDYRLFWVDGMQIGKPVEMRITGDFSSASFILVGAILTEGDVKVKNLDLDLPQADSRIVEIIKEIGGDVKIGSNHVRAIGLGRIGGGRFNLRDSPDLFPIIAASAAKSPEETVIEGIKHVRYKESDRISAMASELRKLGIEVKTMPDGLIIRGMERIRGGVELSSHGDHRIFMALSVLSAATEKGCIIDGTELSKISYPSFLDHLKILGASVKYIG